MFRFLATLISSADGRGSSSELGYLLSVVTLCFITIVVAYTGDSGTLIALAGILAGQTGGTKVMKTVSDSSVKKAQFNPDPAAIAIPAALGPTTIINTAPAVSTETPKP